MAEFMVGDFVYCKDDDGDDIYRGTIVYISKAKDDLALVEFKTDDGTQKRKWTSFNELRYLSDVMLETASWE